MATTLGGAGDLGGDTLCSPSPYDPACYGNGAFGGGGGSVEGAGGGGGGFSGGAGGDAYSYYQFPLVRIAGYGGGGGVTSPERARRINAIMMTCGHYDAPGAFAYRVGLPAAVLNAIESRSRGGFG